MTRRAYDAVALTGVLFIGMPVVGSIALGCGGRGDAQNDRTTAAALEQPAPPAPVAEAEPVERPALEAEAEVAPSEATSVSDAEVTAFADVIVRLAMLEQQGMARVEAGEPPADVSSSLAPEVDRIFEGGVIDAERFNEIAKQAEDDAALRARIETRLEERIEEATA